MDISQLQFMLEKAKGYGYKKVGFILDRGYFGKGKMISKVSIHWSNEVIMIHVL